MVKLAQSLNTKLTLSQSASTSSPTSTTAAPNEDEATLIRTSLVQLGLPTPALTLDMVKGEKAYFEGLARELGVLLTGSDGQGKGLMVGAGGRGVIGLDEVWGLWMRARGVGK
jgi:ESCRT-II complex subunit VPS36